MRIGFRFFIAVFLFFSLLSNSHSADYEDFEPNDFSLHVAEDEAGQRYLYLLGRRNFVFVGVNALTPIPVSQQAPDFILPLDNWESISSLLNCLGVCPEINFIPVPESLSLQIIKPLTTHVIDLNGDGVEEIYTPDLGLTLSGLTGEPNAINGYEALSPYVLNQQQYIDSLQLFVIDSDSGLPEKNSSVIYSILDHNADGIPDFELDQAGVTTVAYGDVLVQGWTFGDDFIIEPKALVGTVKGNFSVDNAGAANYQVPLSVPPGVNKLQPKLSFNYNSSASTGLLGVGWHLNGISRIRRCASDFYRDGEFRVISFDEFDNYCLGNSRLIPDDVESGVFYPELTPGTKVVLNGGHSDPSSFDVYYSNGYIDHFTPQLFSSEGDTISWYLSKREDRFSNQINYSYQYFEDTGQSLISAIHYEENQIEFQYVKTDRGNIQYFLGKENIRKRFLKRVNLKTNGNLVSFYSAQYSTPGLAEVALSTLHYCDAFGKCLAPLSVDWLEKESRLFGTASKKSSGFSEDDGWDLSKHLFYTRDLNLDGTDDIIGFGKKGVYVMSSSRGSVDFVLNKYGSNQGWNTDDHIRVLADIDGNGMLDIVGFGDNGVSTALSDGDFGFNNQGNVLSTFGYNQGYSVKANPRYVVDINGDRFADIVAFGDAGVEVALSNGNGSFAPPVNVLSLFGVDQGWKHKKHKRFIADVNGDGSPDIVAMGESNIEVALGVGDGTFNYIGVVLSDYTIGQGWTSTEERYLVDINGDGNSDIVGFYTDGLHVALANGLGSFVNLGRVSSSYSSSSGWGGNKLTHFKDLNNDGLSDIVGFDSDGDLYIGYSLGDGRFTSHTRKTVIKDSYKYKLRVEWEIGGDDSYAIWEGYGDERQCNSIHRALLENDSLLYLTNPPIDGSISPGEYISDVDCSVKVTALSVGLNFLADYSGDGTADVLKITPISGVYGLSGLSVKTMLEAFDAGLGTKTKVNYGTPLSKTRNSDYPVVTLRGPKQVVASVETDNLKGGTNKLEYSFKNFQVHTLGLGAFGFEELIQTNPQTNMRSTRMLSQDWNSRTQGLLVSSKTEYITGSEATLVESTTNSLDSKVISLGDKSLYFPYVSLNEVKTYDLAGVFLGRKVTEKTYTPRYANLDELKEFNYDATDTLLHQSLFDYDYYESSDYIDRWQTSLVERKEVTVSGNTTLPFGVSDSFKTIQEYEYYYQGVVEKEETIFSLDPLKKLTQEFDYHAMGMLISTTLSAESDVAEEVFETRTTTLNYDELGRLKSKRNALNQKTDTFVYNDSRFPRLPTNHWDINQLETFTEYDSLGEIKFVKEPFERSTDTIKAWCTDVVCDEGEVYYVEIAPSLSSSTTVFYDALNRPIRNTALAVHDIGFGVELVTTLKVYNSLGQIEKESLPYFGNEASYWTSYSYDDMGRTATINYPNGRISTFTYNGLETTLLDEGDGRSQITRKMKNVLGQVVKVTDAQSNETDYRYSARGNLVRTTLNGINPIESMFSSFNTNVKSSDPDLGEWQFVYNMLGELIEQKDAKGQVTRFEYDKIGRLYQRVDDYGKTSAMTTSWVYDEGDMGLGKLRSVSAPGFSETYAYYSETGLLRSTTSLTSHGTFVSSNTYDDFGRVKTHAYPKSETDSVSGLVVRNRYHSELGFLVQVENDNTSEVFWKFQGQWELGNLKSVKYGNLMEVEFGIDHTDGKVSLINAHRLGETLKYMTYDFDYMGNLSKRVDLHDNGNITEDFTYDSLNRLATYNINSPLLNQSDFIVTYQPNGNIKYKPGIGDYSYGSTCNGVKAGPHAVSRIVGAKANNFCYDKNGNMVSDNDRSLTYTSFDKPLRVTLTNEDYVEYSYGPNRELLTRIEKQGAITTNQLNLQGYQRQIRGAEVEHRYSIGDYAVVIEKNSSQSTSYLIRDYLGTIISTVGVDNDELVIEDFSYDPWGVRRTATLDALDANFESPVTELGYGGHQQEDYVGLVHMGGRIYDPALGRFLSPDIVVQSPHLSQNYNRYSYVLNNPLSLADPTGYEYLEFGFCMGDCERGFRIGYGDDDGNYNEASIDFDFTGAPQFGLDFSHLSAPSFSLEKIDALNVLYVQENNFFYSLLGPDWQVQACNDGYKCGVNLPGSTNDNYVAQKADDPFAQKGTTTVGVGTSGAYMFGIIGGDATAEVGFHIDWDDLASSRSYVKVTSSAILGAGYYLGAGPFLTLGHTNDTQRSGGSGNFAYTVVVEGGEVFAAGVSGDLNLNALSQGVIAVDLARAKGGGGAGAMVGSGIRSVLQFNGASPREVWDFARDHIFE
ncbi:MAG: FG-GAP-like repeat-containing protein [Pseudomonadales bacterium]|nr:FG-GAP-like repeat-containing protein [Pseudomonadales bacterium]